MISMSMSFFSRPRPKTAALYLGLFTSALMLWTIYFVDAVLVALPVDTEALKGQRVQLNCTTSESQYSVLWQHIPYGSTDPKYVFIHSVLVDPYDKRFTVDVDKQSGRCNLIISNVGPDDAGVYRCIEKAGLGQRSEADLTILNSTPDCKLATGFPVLCGSSDNLTDVRIRCSARFYGNIAPEIQFQAKGRQNATNCSFNQDGFCDLHLRVEPTELINDTYPFECFSKRSNSLCTTSIPYAFQSSSVLRFNQSTNVSCPVISNQPCHYTWTNNDSMVTVGTEQILQVVNPDQYQCIAECSLQGQTCRIVSMVVYSADKGSTREETAGTAHTIFVSALAIILPISLIMIIIPITIFFIRRKTACICRRINSIESSPGNDTKTSVFLLVEAEEIKINPRTQQMTIEHDSS